MAIGTTLALIIAAGASAAGSIGGSAIAAGGATGAAAIQAYAAEQAANRQEAYGREAIDKESEMTRDAIGREQGSTRRAIDTEKAYREAASRRLAGAGERAEDVMASGTQDATDLERERMEGALDTRTAGTSKAIAGRNLYTAQGYSAEGAGTARSLGLQKALYDEQRNVLNPYVGMGKGATDQLRNLTATGELYKPFEGLEDFEGDPGYQFRLKEGQKGVDRIASRGGRVLGGRALKEMDRFSQGFASDEYSRAYSRTEDTHRADQASRNQSLMSLAGFGERATGQRLGAARNYGAQAGADITGSGRYKGDAILDAGAFSGAARLGDVGYGADYRRGTAATERGADLASLGYGTSARLGTEQAIAGMEQGSGRYGADLLQDSARWRASNRIGSGRYTGEALLGIGQYGGNALMGAGNAQAAGRVGSGNAWAQGLAGAGNSFMDAYFMNQMSQPNSQSPTQDFNPTGWNRYGAQQQNLSSDIPGKPGQQRVGGRTPIIDPAVISRAPTDEMKAAMERRQQEAAAGSPGQQVSQQTESLGGQLTAPGVPNSGTGTLAPTGTSGYTGGQEIPEQHFTRNGQGAMFSPTTIPMQQKLIDAYPNLSEEDIAFLYSGIKQGMSTAKSAQAQGISLG